MDKLNSILLTTVVIFLTFLFQVNKVFGQMATEKEILLTEYPIYFDGLRNSMVEAQISDSFIAKNKVKLVTQLIRTKQIILTRFYLFNVYFMTNPGE
ncbi:hypothetical protein HX039_01500 [Myroides marinus]|nr:hypothetical protein [Myroides marinus]